MERKVSIGSFKDKTFLELHGKDIEDEDAKNIAQALRDSKIRDLYLFDNCISLSSLAIIADVLKDTQITWLDLSECAIKDEGVNYLAKVLKDTKITVLKLNSNGISCTSIKYLADILKDTQITILSLRKNNIRDKGLNYLTVVLKDTKIVKLDLKENMIGFKAALCLNKILNTTKIEMLFLDIVCTKSHASGLLCVSQCSLTKSKMIHRITIEDNNIGIDGVRYFNESFHTTGIYKLNLHVELDESSAEYFAQAFKDLVIHKLLLHSEIIWDAGKFMAQAFKESHIVALRFSSINHSGLEHLIRFLKEVNVLSLWMSSCHIGNAGLSLLAPVMKESNVMYIDLEFNHIGPEGLNHLSRALQDSKIVHLGLSYNEIEIDDLKYLADGLPGTEVTCIYLDTKFNKNENIKHLVDIVEDTNLSCVVITDDLIKINSLKISRSATSFADEICNAFKTAVSLNPVSGEFEFVLPQDRTGFKHHVFLIKTLLVKANSKVHIVDMMCRLDDPLATKFCTYDYDKMRKIDEFIIALPRKFNTFFNDKLSDFMRLLGTNINEYIELVKMFEEADLGEIVQNFLLHRMLYYVDENQDILHPYIYKLLSKYEMPLYNEQVEPKKKDKIISYYKDHPEINGAKDIIDLLRPTSPMEF